MALLSLAEAKAALNITTSTHDAELEDYIDGAIAAVEFICGGVTSVATTEVVRACGAIPLGTTPVISLTSVTGDMVGARDITELRVNTSSGVVRAKANYLPIAEDTYTVVYASGRASAPAAMKQAAKIILKHQWSTQRGPAARRPTSDEGSFVPGLGYAVPNAALQMLAPYDRGPAVG